MHLKSHFTAALACICLFALACAETARQGQASSKTPVSYPLPWIKKECTTCHLPAGAHKPEELKKKLSGLCLDCHRDRKAPAEHKVDIVPKMAVKGLPLFEGKMTCVTCHDPHANVNGKMLRMPASKLCLACHPV